MCIKHIHAVVMHFSLNLHGKVHWNFCGYLSIFLVIGLFLYYCCWRFLTVERKRKHDSAAPIDQMCSKPNSKQRTALSTKLQRRHVGFVSMKPFLCTSNSHLMAYCGVGGEHLHAGPGFWSRRHRGQCQICQNSLWPGKDLNFI